MQVEREQPEQPSRNAGNTGKQERAFNASDACAARKVSGFRGQRSGEGQEPTAREI